MERKYCYPDADDKLTKALVIEKEQYQGYWEESEKQILNIAKKEIKQHEFKSENSWLLDAGCGTGRLLPEFQKYFSNILAIDPDHSQIEKAKKTVLKKGFAEKVVFNVTPADQLDWKKESINVILCSHVIQHVRTDMVPKILDKFHELLTPNGLLFLLTAHSRRSYGYYVKSLMKDSKLIEERIMKEEFNSLVKNSRNILPIHFFSMKNLVRILENSGFVLMDFRAYHITRKLKIFAPNKDIDELVNSSDYLRTKFGRDIMLTIKKQAV